MANSKISELTELTSVANDDVLVIVDDSASETKKISFANLSSGISVGNATELQFTALNSTGATITKGSPVYVSGHTTETQVADADNSSASTMPNAFHRFPPSLFVEGLRSTNGRNRSMSVKIMFVCLVGVFCSSFSYFGLLFASSPLVFLLSSAKNS